MTAPPETPTALIYDRQLLLYGPKREKLLTLEEIEQYGTDTFADPDHVSIFGMKPSDWYARGIRLLGRTAVECTGDALGDLIGRDVAAIAQKMPATDGFVVLDPFAGSGNTLFWILRHLGRARGIAFELAPAVFQLTERNLRNVGSDIELMRGDFSSLLPQCYVPPRSGVIVFIAPPWGRALDETKGLDLRRTEPPVLAILNAFERRYASRRLLFAIQVYETVDADSRLEAESILDWSVTKTYGLNAKGRNHGVLLATKGWSP
jgi:hypothetical protein